MGRLLVFFMQSKGNGHYFFNVYENMSIIWSGGFPQTSG